MQRTHPVSAYEDVDDLSAQSGMDGHDVGAAAADMAAKDRAKKQIADILAQVRICSASHHGCCFPLRLCCCMCHSSLGSCAGLLQS